MQDFATAEVDGYTDNLMQSLNALFLSPVANKAMRAKAPGAESRACPFMGWLLGFSLILGRFDGVGGSDTSTGIEAGSVSVWIVIVDLYVFSQSSTHKPTSLHEAQDWRRKNRQKRHAGSRPPVPARPC
jgi:hypothetical protein